MGLPQTGRIARVLIHPTDPNTVYVCAEGRLTGPQEERGVFKTSDGGGTWQRILFVDQKTGCSGLALDPNDPNTLLAGTWQVEQHTWAQLSGGPGSGVYITHDGGAKWTKVTSGMPKAPVGKIDVAIAASNPKRMYALIQTADQGSLWRSDDAGLNWSVVSWDRSLIGRAGYYIRLAVNPQNPDDVFISSSSFHRSQDGGKTFSGNGGGPFAFTQGQASCGDCHDIWIDPKDPVRYVLTDDAGANINTRQGTIRVSLPNGQMYHVHVDNRVPYWIYSNRQDDGTMRGPSTRSEQTANGRLPDGSFMPTPPLRAGRGGRGRGAAAPGGAAAGTQGGRAAPPETPQPAPDLGASAVRANTGPAWEPNIGGCESGFTIPDPTDANIVYASCYGNKVTRWDARTGTARSIEPWLVSLDSPPNEARYRCHWTAPMAIDPFDHNTLLYGCQLILKTTNGGQSWAEASPDLSTKDPTRIVSNGGIVGDNLGQYSGEVIWDIEYLEDSEGPDLGRHQRRKALVTKDGGANWTDVTKNFKDLPPWGTFTQISPSAFDPGTAYVGRRFPSDGRSQAVHLQDNRLWRDLDEGHRQHSERPSARLRPVAGREPEQEGHALRRHRPRVLLLAGRRHDVDAVQGRTAACAGQLDHHRAAVPRRRRLDLRARPLHPAQHHAARADRAGRRRRRRRRKRLRAGGDRPPGARSVSADRPSAFHARAGRRRRPARSRWRSSTRAAR